MLRPLSRERHSIRSRLSCTSSLCFEGLFQHHADEDVFPHAETSAAGAARNERLRRRSLCTQARAAHPQGRPRSRALPDPLHSSITRGAPLTRSVSNGASQPLKTVSPRHNRPEFNVPLRKDYPSLQQRFLEWQATMPQAGQTGAMIDIGWKTPSELAGIDTSQRLLRDVELIKRSLWHDRLLSLFELVRPLFLRLTEGHSFSKQPQRSRQDLRNATLGLLATLPREDSSSAPLFPADTTAFHVVGTILLETQILAGLSDATIHRTLLGMNQWSLRPMTLPFLHRIVSTAGKEERYHLVGLIYEYAYRAWNESTDEWMLYARARGIAHTEGIENVDEYWKVYNVHRLADPAAYGELHYADPARQRRLVPPRYLFAFIAQRQMALGTKSGRRASKRTLEVMEQHGYPARESPWLSRLRASLNLRLQLPSLFSPIVARRYETLPEESLPLRMLRQRAEALDVRDVFRVLRLMRIQISKRPPSQQAVSVGKPSISPVEQLQALAVLGQLFGRLGFPDRAYDIFVRCLKLERELDILDQKCSGMAATGVIAAYDSNGQAFEGFKFGKLLLSEVTPYALTPTSHIVGVSLRSAAALPDSEAAVRESLSLHGLMTQRGLPFDSHVCMGLAAHLFSLREQSPPDWHGVRVIIRALVSMTRPSDGSEPQLSRTSKERLMHFLYELRKTGIEEHLVTRQVRLAQAHFSGMFRGMGTDQLDGTEQTADGSVSPPDTTASNGPEVSLHGKVPLSPGSPSENPPPSEQPASGPATDTAAFSDPCPTDLPLSEPTATDSSAPDSQPSGPPPSDRAAYKRPAFDPHSYKLHQFETLPSDSLESETPITGQPSRADSPSSDLNSCEPPSSDPSPSDDYLQWSREAETLVQEDLFGAARGETSSSDVNGETYRLMQSSGYAVRGRDLSGIRRDHISAADLFQGMIARGHRPNMLHVAPLVEGLCLDGRVDDAMVIARDAQWETGTLTTGRIEAAIIRALIKAGRKADAEVKFAQWCEAGGRADAYLHSLFNEDGRPPLASQAGFTGALNHAKETEKPLSITPVAEAFLWLVRHRKHKSAQYLILQATLTGMQWDGRLRKTVRNSGRWLLNLVNRRAENSGQVQAHNSKSRLPTLDETNSELSNEELIDALKMHERAMFLSKVKNRAQWVRARDRHRRAVLDLICVFLGIDLESPVRQNASPSLKGRKQADGEVLRGRRKVFSSDADLRRDTESLERSRARKKAHSVR